jgi:hypothetical protein
MSLILWFGGHKQVGLTTNETITGAWASFTLTIIEQVEVLLHASVAVHLIVLAPLFKTTLAIVAVPLVVVAPVTLHARLGVEQLSVADALNSVP